MKVWQKVPLYLGLSVFVLSILVSGVKLGEQQAINTALRANVAGAVLSLTYTDPDILSLIVSSDSPVNEVRAKLLFDPSQIAMTPLPSETSLFTVSGGPAAGGEGAYVIIATAESPLKGGVVVNLRVRRKAGHESDPVEIRFASDDSMTYVIEGQSHRDILKSTKDITLTKTAP